MKQHEYSYHPVHYDSRETRYRVIAQDGQRILFERIFKKEANAKSYVDHMMCKPFSDPKVKL
jgi:hypothetical protein